MTRYPIEPLAAVLHIELHQVGGQTGRWADSPAHGLQALAQALGLSHSRMKQLARHGLDMAAADRAAVSIGRHPAELWPTWWDDAPGEDDAWYGDDPSVDDLDKESVQVSAA